MSSGKIAEVCAVVFRRRDMLKLTIRTLLSRQENGQKKLSTSVRKQVDNNNR
jgi:hypothetical protein